MCDSGVVFRELVLVREMQTGKAALGGARRVRLEKPPA
jgi:hypothetical protein